MIIKKYNITYCSNIFKEQTLLKLLLKIENYSNKLRFKFNTKTLGLSLCISNSLSNNLNNIDSLSFFLKWLTNNKLYMYSINGFVYKTFHIKKIKENIYYPDWTSNKRFLYTKKLILLLDIINNILYNGSISTVPVSSMFFLQKKNIKYFFYKTSININKILFILIDLYNNKKKYIHLDIEPEPYCLIENIINFIFFYNNWITPLSIQFLYKKLKINKIKSIYHIKNHINLCYDICHFSIICNNHLNIIKLIKKNNISIGRLQISSALKALFYKNANLNTILKTELLFLINSNFLHQTTLINKKKYIYKYPDIFPALNSDLNNIIELRTHCHLPIYMNHYKNFLFTTNNETKNCILKILKTFKIYHLEIETYTYNFISKKNKIISIIKEYLWLINLIEKIKK